jgi:hypothetical protein
MAVTAPPRVRVHLRKSPDGPVAVLHRGPDAVYLDVAGRCVGVVTPHATAVPCALRSQLPSLEPAAEAWVADGELVLDGVPLRVGRIVDVAVPRLSPATRERLRAERARPEARAGIQVDALLGAGDGLTPYGDDVLCGWLAVHRAAGVATPEVDAEVARLAARTTLLSATLLDCAAHGEVIPEFAELVRALGTDAEPAAAAALEAVGHSSGRGLLEGARTALGELGLGVAA